MNRRVPSKAFSLVVCAPDAKEHNTIEICIDGYPGHLVGIDFTYVGLGALLLQDVQERGFDVLFLDVAIKDIFYMDLARLLRANDPDFILVLLIDEPEQAIDGYGLRAFRCLYKHSLYGQLEECLPELFYELGIGRDMVSFRCSDSICHVYADEILYAESQRHTVYVHYLGKHHEPSPVYDSLADVERILAPHGFVRIHHSFIINPEHLVDVKGYYAILNAGQELPISRPLHNEVKDILKAKKSRPSGLSIP